MIIMIIKIMASGMKDIIMKEIITIVIKLVSLYYSVKK